MSIIFNIHVRMNDWSLNVECNISCKWDKISTKYQSRFSTIRNYIEIDYSRFDRSAVTFVPFLLASPSSSDISSMLYRRGEPNLFLQTCRLLRIGFSIPLKVPEISACISREGRLIYCVEIEETWNSSSWNIRENKICPDHHAPRGIWILKTIYTSSVYLFNANLVFSPRLHQ